MLRHTISGLFVLAETGFLQCEILLLISCIACVLFYYLILGASAWQSLALTFINTCAWLHLVHQKIQPRRPARHDQHHLERPGHNWQGFLPGSPQGRLVAGLYPLPKGARPKAVEPQRIRPEKHKIVIKQAFCAGSAGICSYILNSK